MMHRYDQTMQFSRLSDYFHPQERAIGEVKRLAGFTVQDTFDRFLALLFSEAAQVLESNLYLALRENALLVPFLVEACTQRAMPAHHPVDRVLHHLDRKRPFKMKYKTLVKSAACLAAHLQLDPHLALLHCKREVNG